jgi:uncharacterized membrane protein YphA (DoxX/SURF4 family)
MFVVTIILAVLLALGYGMAGTQKITGAKMMMDSADHLGVPRPRYKVIGALELLAAIGLLVGLAWWPLGVAAGIGLVLLMIGAVTFHLRAGDKIGQFGPAAALGVVALLEVIFRAASA